MKTTSRLKVKRKLQSAAALRLSGRYTFICWQRVFIGKVLLKFRFLIDCCEDTAIQLDGGPLPGEEPSPGKIYAVGANLRTAEVSFDYYVNVLMFSELPVPFWLLAVSQRRTSGSSD